MTKSKKPYFTIIKSDLGREAVLAEDYADLIERHAKLESEHADALRALKAERERAGK